MRFPRAMLFIPAAMLLASCGATPNGALSPSPQATTVEANSTREAETTPSAAASPGVTEPILTAEPILTEEPSATTDPTTSTAPSATTDPTITAEPSAAPTGSAGPTLEPTAPISGTASANSHTITIAGPQPSAAISSPITVTGEANFWPFEGTLAGVVKDADGKVLGAGPLSVEGEGAPQGGPFGGVIAFAGPATAQNGVLEVFEASAKDGSILAIERRSVRLQAATTSGLQLDAPEFAQDVTLPLHIALRVNPPLDRLTARLTFSNGPVLEQRLDIVKGTDGVGYGVANMTWNTEGPPPTTEPGPATLQIVDLTGTVQRELTVNMLPADATQPVKVAWRAGDEIITFEQRVPKTEGIGAAALRELLNGPPNGNLAGADTALPSTEQILRSPQRAADWGYQVRLIDLAIADGVATANFSSELRAYDGDPRRAEQIHQQIERTLTQFSTVKRVVIQIDGQTDSVLH